LVWIWTGSGDPSHEIPEPPELEGTDYDFAVGRAFAKKCHPNVVMINAIDEQHFQTVHRVPGHLMQMEHRVVSDRQILFQNTAKVPATNAFFRWAARFYRGPLCYELSYWYGCNGIVTMGPDFLHVYIMFASRQTAAGSTEGQTLVFTRKRKGIIGWCSNRIVLLVTRLVGNYFSVGDTKVFQSIRFDYRTPVPADRAVQAFIRHLEKQPLADWAEESQSPGPRQRVPVQPEQEVHVPA
jgi:phenylpropionate dioxygenase-like ring-hydroxylating dioxygenase large terminal subunit